MRVADQRLRLVVLEQLLVVASSERVARYLYAGLGPTLSFDRGAIENAVSVVLRGNDVWREGGLRGLSTTLVTIAMNDRPVSTTSMAGLVQLLADAYRRADAVSAVTGEDPSELLSGMLDLLDGSADSCVVWHVSLVAGAMDDDALRVGAYRLSAGSTETHGSIADSFCPSGFEDMVSHPNKAELWYSETTAQPGPLILASRNVVDRRGSSSSPHEFFDFLNLVYADHHLFVTFCNKVLGRSPAGGGSFAFDTGPGAATSWSTRGGFGVGSLRSATSDDLQLLESCVDAFEPFPAWRMLISAADDRSSPIPRLMTLRAIIDPLLEHKPNRAEVDRRKERQSSGGKIPAQVSLIVDSLTAANLLPSESRLEDRLCEIFRVRNAWVHRTSSEALGSLWSSYEDLPLLREVVDSLLILVGKQHLAGKQDVLKLL